MSGVADIACEAREVAWGGLRNLGDGVGAISGYKSGPVVSEAPAVLMQWGRDLGDEPGASAVGARRGCCSGPVVGGHQRHWCSGGEKRAMSLALKQWGRDVGAKVDLWLVRHLRP